MLNKQIKIFLLVCLLVIFNQLVDALKAQASVTDTDKDGLTNDQELIMDTDPELSDSDGDRFLDGAEVRSGYNPLGPGLLTEVGSLTKKYLLNKNTLINQGWLDLKIKQRAWLRPDKNWMWYSQILNATSSPQLLIKTVNSTNYTKLYQDLITPLSNAKNCIAQNNTWGEKSITFTCQYSKNNSYKNTYTFYGYKNWQVSFDNSDQGFTNRQLAWKILTLIDNQLKSEDPETIILDSDKDGLSDFQERSLGTDPLKIDSDDDGHSDYQEIKNGYNPLGPGLLQTNDPDHDGLTNDQELIFGTDPWNKDTDGDGFNDYNEIRTGFNPLGAGKISS